jgi:hypothetical protein
MIFAQSTFTQFLPNARYIDRTHGWCDILFFNPGRLYNIPLFSYPKKNSDMHAEMDFEYFHMHACMFRSTFRAESHGDL